MTRIFFFTIVFLQLILDVNAQTAHDSDIKEHPFQMFLMGFSSIKTPFNYKKELSTIGLYHISLKGISRFQAVNVLKMKEQELFAKRLVYNNETFEKVYTDEDNLPVAHLKFKVKDYIGVIYRYGLGDDNDTVFVYLSLFKKNGEFLDSKVIGEQFSRENDWVSSIFVDENHFKIFYYKLNPQNFKIVNGTYNVIDPNGFKTILNIEDYSIDTNGKINFDKKYPVVYLPDYLFEYKAFNKGIEDPMNQD